MTNIFDLMSSEDRATMEKWAEQRKQSVHKRDIPSPLYIAGELGYYYGWGAVQDFMRGYTIGITPGGAPERYAFPLEQAVGLIEAARKVHYRQALDQSRANAAYAVSSNDKKFSRKNASYINKLVDYTK